MNRSSAMVRPVTVMLSLNGNPPVPVEQIDMEGPEVQYVRSDSATMPNPKWSKTDSHGHTHRWTYTERDWRDDALPTLIKTYEHIGCDGSCGNWDCDGYDVPVWHCRECSDQVKPGFKPDYEARTTGIRIETGPPTYTFTLHSAPEPFDPNHWGSEDWHRELRAEITGELALTGRAWVDAPEWTYDGFDQTTVFKVHVSPDNWKPRR